MMAKTKKGDMTVEDILQICSFATTVRLDDILGNEYKCGQVMELLGNLSAEMLSYKVLSMGLDGDMRHGMMLWLTVEGM